MDILSEKVIKYYKNQKPPNENSLFTDELFPPNENSLLSLDDKGNYTDLIDGKEKASYIKSDKIIWKRASEIFDNNYSIFNSTNTISMSDIKQGKIGNCYFLSPLASLTVYPDLIHNIFKTKTINKYGYYEIILYIDGEFQIVLIDDYFPVKKNNEKKLVFAQANDNIIWVIILEKAWAKVNGGYSNIIGGSPADSLRALTGFSKLTIKNKDYNINELYDKISEALNYKFICCCTTVDEVKNGLLANHAFTIIKCIYVQNKDYRLIKLRNPWGYMEWSSQLREKCNFWYEELKRDNNYEDNDNDNDDKGIFYMEINDFKEHFLTTDICYVIYNCKIKLYNCIHYNNLPHVFKLFINNDNSMVSISLSKKFWRFNRIMKEKQYPSSCIITKINEGNDENQKVNFTDFIGNYESEDDVDIFKIFNKGYYLIYTYCDFNHSDEPKLDKYSLIIRSNEYFKSYFCHYDYDFCLLRYIIICSSLENMSLKDKQLLEEKKEIISCTGNDYLNSGFAYRIVFNGTLTETQIWENSIDNLKNIFLLPPYTYGGFLKKDNTFTFYVEPQTVRIILGMRKSKFGTYWYSLCSKFNNVVKNQDNLNTINDYILTQEIINLFILTNINEYNMIYDYISLPLNISSINNISNPILEEIKLDYPEIINQLLILPKTLRENILIWKKIKYKNGIYIGLTLKDYIREGRGVFIWNDLIPNDTNDILKYSIGYWKNDKREGFQRDYNKDNFCIFEGNYINNERNGLGNLFWETGENFHGFFKNGKRNGFGIITWKDGSKWEGNFTDGVMDGRGIFYPKNNNNLNKRNKRNNGYITIYQKGKFIQ